MLISYEHVRYQNDLNSYTFPGEAMQCGIWPLTSWLFFLTYDMETASFQGIRSWIEATFERKSEQSQGRRWCLSPHLSMLPNLLLRPTTVEQKPQDIDVMINVCVPCNMCSVKLPVIPVSVNGRVWETGNVSSLEFLGPHVGFYSLSATFDVCFLQYQL